MDSDMKHTARTCRRQTPATCHILSLLLIAAAAGCAHIASARTASMAPGGAEPNQEPRRRLAGNATPVVVGPTGPALWIALNDTLSKSTTSPHPSNSASNTTTSGSSNSSPAASVILTTNATITWGMPGPWGLSPSTFNPATVSAEFGTPYQGPAQQDGTNNAAAPGPLTLEAQLVVTQSVTLKSSTSPGQAVLLDMGVMRDVFVVPHTPLVGQTSTNTNSSSAATNSTTNTSASSPPAVLTLANLTLFHLPFGPPGHYPLSLSSLPMWSVSMDRSMPPGVAWGSPPTGSTPGPDGGSNQRRVWVPPQGWVTEPKLIIKDCTLEVSSSEISYWLSFLSPQNSFAGDRNIPQALACTLSAPTPPTSPPRSTARFPPAPPPDTARPQNYHPPARPSVVATTEAGGVPTWLTWLEELGLGLPLVSYASVNPWPALRVCSWSLNWGRIVFENVTIEHRLNSPDTPSGLAVLNDYRTFRVPGAGLLYSWPPPLTMALAMPPSPSRTAADADSTPADNTGIMRDTRDGSAVFDTGLLLSPPNTSAAEWVDTRFVVVTTNISWPSEAQLMETLIRSRSLGGGSNEDGSNTDATLPLGVSGRTWVIFGRYDGTDRTPLALDFANAPPLGVRFMGQVVFWNLLLMNLQAPGPGIGMGSVNCTSGQDGSGAAAGVISLFELPFWPLDFCRSNSNATSAATSITNGPYFIELRNSIVLLPPPSFQLLSALHSGFEVLDLLEQLNTPVSPSNPSSTSGSLSGNSSGNTPALPSSGSTSSSNITLSSGTSTVYPLTYAIANELVPLRAYSRTSKFLGTPVVYLCTETSCTWHGVRITELVVASNPVPATGTVFGTPLPFPATSTSLISLPSFLATPPAPEPPSSSTSGPNVLPGGPPSVDATDNKTQGSPNSTTGNASGDSSSGSGSGSPSGVQGPGQSQPLAGGAVAGLVIGALALVTLLTVLVTLLILNRRRSTSSRSSGSSDGAQMPPSKSNDGFELQELRPGQRLALFPGATPFNPALNALLFPLQPDPAPPPLEGWAGGGTTSSDNRRQASPTSSEWVKIMFKESSSSGLADQAPPWTSEDQHGQGHQHYMRQQQQHDPRYSPPPAPGPAVAGKQPGVAVGAQRQQDGANQHGRGVGAVAVGSKGTSGAATAAASHSAHLALIERELMVIQADFSKDSRPSGRLSKASRGSGAIPEQQSTAGDRASKTNEGSGAAPGQQSTAGAWLSALERARDPRAVGPEQKGAEGAGVGAGVATDPLEPDAGSSISKAVNVAHQSEGLGGYDPPDTLSFGASWSAGGRSVMLGSGGCDGKSDQQVPLTDSVSNSHNESSAGSDGTPVRLGPPTLTPTAELESSTSAAHREGGTSAVVSGTSGLHEAGLMNTHSSHDRSKVATSAAATASEGTGSHDRSKVATSAAATASEGTGSHDRSKVAPSAAATAASEGTGSHDRSKVATSAAATAASEGTGSHGRSKVATSAAATASEGTGATSVTSRPASSAEPPSPADYIPGLKLTDVLGGGSYGTVYKGQWRGLEVAVKRVVFQALGQGPAGDARRAQVLREAEVSTRLDHPNLIATYTCTMVPLGHSDSEVPGNHLDWALVLVQEYADGGSLLSEIQGGRLSDPATGRVDLSRVLQYAGDVAEGMAYLHAQRIIHRDLKPDNVLVKSDPQPAGQVQKVRPLAKVCDFGLSHALPMDRSVVSGVRHGTPMYVAPEVLQSGKASKAADVYAFGVMCWELLHQRTAWDQLLSTAAAHPHSSPSLSDLTALLRFDDLERAASRVDKDQQAQREGAGGEAGSSQQTHKQDGQEGLGADVGRLGHVEVQPHHHQQEGHLAQVQLERSLRSSFARLAASCMSHDPGARPAFTDIVRQIDRLRRQQAR